MFRLQKKPSSFSLDGLRIGFLSGSLNRGYSAAYWFKLKTSRIQPVFIASEFWKKRKRKKKKSNHFFCVVQITDGRMELCYLLLLPVEDGMFDPVAATASFYCHLVDSRRPCEGKNTKAFWDWSEMRPSAAAGCFSPLCCFSIIFRFTVLTVTCFCLFF